MIDKGAVLADRYEIIDIIGIGGMSVVFKALDMSLTREVAIKVLKDEYITDNAFVSKFRAEATAAAGLEHPNIVNVYDVGTQEGTHFIVMEYVEGITLKSYISKKGYLSSNELLSVAIQVGRGIEAAHKKNIIHRDIKPQNIIISKDGKVKVTDFGIARAVTSNTINADRMGSVHYSSPEQTRNGHVTFQSDIYSLGMVMYEMCTGEVPFDGETVVAIALKHLQSELTPPSEIVDNVPISVEKIIMRASMKSPDRRYRDMTEMLTDLKRALISPDEDFVFIPSQNDGGNEEDLQEEEVKPEKRKPKAKRAAKSGKKKFMLPLLNDDNEDEEDQGGISRKMDKAVTIMGIIAAVVIILIVVYLLGTFFGFFASKNKNKEPVASSVSAEQVQVPDILGKTEAEAIRAIEAAGFKYKKLGEASSKDYKEGQVMEQNPGTKEKASKGSSISFMISSGEGTIDVPNVVGSTQEQAMSRIKEAGFESNIQTEYSDVEQGKVTRQNPAAGQKANKKDTITIWISRGQELVSVPGVVNYTEDEARNALARAGFPVTVVSSNSDTVEAGRIISQSHTGQVNPGTAVTITVSLGKKVTYSYSVRVVPAEGEQIIVVLQDESGNQLGEARTVTTDSTLTYSGMSVSKGILFYNGVSQGVVNFTPNS